MVATVKFLHYDGVPEVQQVLLDALAPLAEEDFVVAAARHGLLGHAVDDMTPAGGAQFTKTEREIEQDCRQTLAGLIHILDDDGRSSWASQQRLAGARLFSILGPWAPTHGLCVDGVGRSASLWLGRGLHCGWPQVLH
jgi:hypothetical protein